MKDQILRLKATGHSDASIMAKTGCTFDDLPKPRPRKKPTQAQRDLTKQLAHIPVPAIAERTGLSARQVQMILGLTKAAQARELYRQGYSIYRIDQLLETGGGAVMRAVRAKMEGNDARNLLPAPIFPPSNVV